MLERRFGQIQRATPPAGRRSTCNRAGRVFCKGRIPSPFNIDTIFGSSFVTASASTALFVTLCLSRVALNDLRTVSGGFGTLDSPHSFW